MMTIGKVKIAAMIVGAVLTGAAAVGVGIQSVAHGQGFMQASRIQVLLPDGKPAVGAAVYEVKADGPYVRDPVAGLHERGPTSRPGAGAPQTDANGQFAIPGSWSNSQGLAFVHDDGFAAITRKALQSDQSQVHLERWATIRGVLAPSLRTAGVKMGLGARRLGMSYDLEQDVQPDGSYEFLHVPPGQVTVYRIQPLTRYFTGMSFFDRQVPVDASAGDTATVDFGDSGASIVARAMLPDGKVLLPKAYYAYAELFPRQDDVPESIKRFRAMAATRPAEISGLSEAELRDVARRWLGEEEVARLKKWEQRQRVRHVAFPDDQGVIQFSGVAADRYQLNVHVYEHKLESPWGQGKPVAKLTQSLDVKAHDATVQLGDVQLKPAAQQ